MELSEIQKLKGIAVKNDDLSLIDINGYDYSPYKVIDLEEEDDLWEQRAITSDNRLVHVVDAVVVGRYGDGGDCAWVLKVIREKDGLFEFAKKINAAIKTEYEHRLANKKPHKRWRNNMRSLIVQLFIWDFELLDEAISDADNFINEHVRA